MSDLRRVEPARSTATARGPERRRFLGLLLGLGAVSVTAAAPAAAKPVEHVLDGGRP